MGLRGTEPALAQARRPIIRRGEAMPAFMLELEPPMSSRGAGADEAQWFLDLEADLRRVVEPVGATSHIHRHSVDGGGTKLRRLLAV